MQAKKQQKNSKKTGQQKNCHNRFDSKPVGHRQLGAIATGPIEPVI